MKALVSAILLVAALACIGTAKAAGGCGPGCHVTLFGACVVDGWGTGAQVWNECPATTRPRPPCTYPYVWHKRFHACFASD